MKFVFIIFIFLFSGCSVTVPHIVEYRISPKIDKVQYSAKECRSRSLKIMQSFSKVSLMTNDMKYAQNSYQEFSFTESQWADSPNRAINIELVKSIRDSNLFSNVSGYKSRTSSDFTLESNIGDFMQYFVQNDKKSFVNVVIYMSLIDNKTSKIISSKRITKKLNVEKLDAQSGVGALNKALSDTLSDTNEWLNGVCK